MNQYPSYAVSWSEEDGEYVATCDWFPSLSYLARDCVKALDGLAELLIVEFGEGGIAARQELLAAEELRVKEIP